MGNLYKPAQLCKLHAVQPDLQFNEKLRRSPASIQHLWFFWAAITQKNHRRQVASLILFLYFKNLDTNVFLLSSDTSSPLNFTLHPPKYLRFGFGRIGLGSRKDSGQFSNWSNSVSVASQVPSLPFQNLTWQVAPKRHSATVWPIPDIHKLLRNFLRLKTHDHLEPPTLGDWPSWIFLLWNLPCAKNRIKMHLPHFMMSWYFEAWIFESGIVFESGNASCWGCFMETTQINFNFLGVSLIYSYGVWFAQLLLE